MKHRKPLFKHNEMDKSKYSGMFAFTPIIPQLIIIAIVIGAYYYINAKGYFPLWITYIYYAAKVIVALEIIIMGAKSLVGPLLVIALGALNLYWLQVDGFEIVSPDDSWQLIVMGAIAFVLTFIVRATRKN
jgi:hypothetical protein